MISVHVQREGVGQTSRLVRTQDMRVPSAATAAFAIVIMGSVNALMGMEEEHAKGRHARMTAVGMGDVSV